MRSVPGVCLLSSVFGFAVLPVSATVGGEDYGIYGGTVTSPWAYNHVFKTCTDSVGDLSETLVPGSGDRYFLVVPNLPERLRKRGAGP